ncbi:MAG: Holliday junction branch migration protein RuvA [Eubacteriales bacterium]|nr:Holliday junction branch migration protein RuvA [Eubacteriales bacterium]
MIGYIKGTVEALEQDYILLENNGIGYQIFTSAMVLNQIANLHQTVQIFTYLHVREEGIALFGFLTKRELDTFKLLLTVSGVGPKAALAILSVLSVNDLAVAIMAGDTKAITKANGVGAKGANRIIMELKDKLSLDDMFDQDVVPAHQTSEMINSNTVQDTILALVSLGYSETEAFRAVKQIAGAEEMNPEDLLKQALKKMF